jgi:protein required for attachment to host cells
MSNWIVVANASRARIFEAAAADTQMHEIENLVHPESRQHEGDLISDHAGHVYNGTTGGHSINRLETAKQQEAEGFARYLCETLEHARTTGRFHKLYLIAAPHFLGLLRHHLSRPLQEMVGQEYAKDLTRATEAQIRTMIG